ncbi:hypothetical protein IWQ62_004053 [Dispira parvispora]|uniref:Uncharacterized protein n=1 Tax=Dispira parvispora TaxID=1520584 RepID=A0A9W8AMP1_9FUNG|nr:hypothetical protein IWQ62_004053 [Dispira parvispora]
MIAQFPTPVNMKKPHFLSRLWHKRLQTKKSSSELLSDNHGALESPRPSFVSESATLSVSRGRRSSLVGSHSFSLPRRFQSTALLVQEEAGTVFSPTKQISRGGSPLLTPTSNDAERISFDELIDNQGKDVTIKFSLTPRVAK